jgi:hypothetical protein
MDKKKFLKEEFTKLLSSLKSEAKGKWGKMNAQQMVEHMSGAFRVASGKHIEKSAFTPEITKKSHDFMMSEKPFRENTPNQLLSDEPYPVKNKTMADALAELQAEIDYFFKVYSENPELRVVNPFFGNLNFEEQVQLLHKHTTHHAKQFGL